MWTKTACTKELERFRTSGSIFEEFVPTTRRKNVSGWAENARRVLLLAPVYALLSGCSLTPLQSDFSCPYQDGKACLSMTEADQKIQNPSPQSEKTNHPKCCSADLLPAFNDYPEWTANPPFPKRRPDVVKRLWLAPFEDSDHNWHAASYVYTVDRPAHWVPVGVAVPKALSIVDPDPAVHPK